ncbi:MAG: PD40 domain-containing protein, partial [Bacteroidetes bacterium]|nr:PD40 domain-containing protein [Bacteroidota bacterium]
MKHRKTFILVALFAVILTASGFQTSPEYKILFEKAKFTMETKGDLQGAINLFSDIIKKYPKEREYAAKSQLYIGLCYEKLGVNEAQKAYQKVVNSYPEQTEAVKLANEKLSLLLRAEAVAGKNGEASNQKSTKLLLSGTGSGGKLSPDETQVVYRGGEGNLLVKDLKTGIVKTVVKYGERDGDYAVNLVWSPDGKQVVYTYGAPMLVHDLRIGNIESGESRVIYSDPLTYPFAQDWSADGKSVVCMIRKSKDMTFAGYGVFDIDTRKLGQFVFAEEGEDGTASFSPDGKYIVYDLMEKGNRDLFVYSIATGEKTRLTDSPAEEGQAAWSRDGKYVVFSSNRRGSWDLWAVPIQNAK